MQVFLLYKYNTLMKVAIVHEMLIKMWGAEKVVQSLSDLFPEACIYTSMYDKEKMSKHFPWKTIITSKKTQKIYDITKKQRLSFFYMQEAFENIDLSKYDLVIVSSSGFAHSIITKPETKSIVYYHSPARYLWDWTFESQKDLAKNSFIKKYLFKKIFHKARIYDFVSSQRHDVVLANSNNVKSRIKKYYKLDAKVVYPPVNVKRFQKEITDLYPLPVNKYYIIISALSEFKKIEVAINAFNKLKSNLVIVWEWNYKKTLEKLSNKDWYNKKSKPNIFFVWAKYDDELVFLMQNSLGLIFPWEEDFWIVPIEALWAWKPVFALKAWWLAETIKPWISWEFFYHKDGSDFIEKFLEFEKNIESGVYKKEILQKEASKYDEEIFKKEILKIVREEWFLV